MTKSAVSPRRRDPVLVARNGWRRISLPIELISRATALPLCCCVVSAPSEAMVAPNAVLPSGRSPGTFAYASRSPLQRHSKVSQKSTSRLGYLSSAQRRQAPSTRVIVRSEPGLAERALSLASEVLDKDIAEVLDNAQSSTEAAVNNAHGTIQVKYAPLIRAKEYGWT